MQPTFGLQREQDNKLFYNSYKNVSGKFHFHSQLELFFVDDGEVDVFINDKSRRLKKGEMSVTLSYDAHVYRSAGDSQSSLLIIPPYLCDEFINSVKNKKISNPFLCDADTVSEIRECFEKIKKSDSKIKIHGYIYVIFGIILEKSSFTSVSQTINTELSAQLLLFINENYKNDITLSSLSAKFGYNPSYISRYFKSCFNIGLSHYIKVIRLKNAVILMQEKSTA